MENHDIFLKMTKSLGPAECAPTPKAAGDEAVGMTKSLEMIKSLKMTKSLGMIKSAGILLHSPPLPPSPCRFLQGGAGIRKK